jgi:hypothetical protein
MADADQEKIIAELNDRIAVLAMRVDMLAEAVENPLLARRAEALTVTAGRLDKRTRELCEWLERIGYDIEDDGITVRRVTVINEAGKPVITLFGDAGESGCIMLRNRADKPMLTLLGIAQE